MQPAECHHGQRAAFARLSQDLLTSLAAAQLSAACCHLCLSRGLQITPCNELYVEGSHHFASLAWPSDDGGRTFPHD